VLDQGRVVERGRHAALLASDGTYAQMWALQQQEDAQRRTERENAPAIAVTGM